MAIYIYFFFFLNDVIHDFIRKTSIRKMAIKKELSILHMEEEHKQIQNQPAS